MKKIAPESRRLSRKDIGFIAQALTLASWVFRAAIRSVTAEYGFGPHGAWILVLIDNGQVIYPLDVTNFFNVSRSVITEELARLTESGFITYHRSSGDRRRIELALTPLGKKVSSRVQEELSRLIVERFKSYSRDEVLQFARMLYDFVYAEGMPPGAPIEGNSSAAKRRASSKSRIASARNGRRNQAAATMTMRVAGGRTTPRQYFGSPRPDARDRPA